MTENVEKLSTENKLKSIILKENFWAIMISITSIVVASFMLWWVAIPKSTPLALIFIFFIHLPVILSIFLNFMREDGEFIWVQPILILLFSVGFVAFFFSETNNHNYLKYPEYKQVILSNPDLKEYNESKVKLDFDKIEEDGVIVRYEFVQILDALEVIRLKQKKMHDEVKKIEDERRVKLIKANFGK